MNILFGGLLALQSVASLWPECKNPRTGSSDPARAEWLADSLARRFAPVLSFAPGERFFPTIPFFMAFDGDSLGGDPQRADFEDPWEVAPYLKDSEGNPVLPLHVSWNALMKNYHHDTGKADGGGHGVMDRALNRVVVLYRVCSLAVEQNKSVVRFLKSDEQALERFEDVQSLRAVFGDTVLGPDGKPAEFNPQFDVIQFFLYYLADKGLQGHPNDIELVSVFFPRNQRMLDKFRIIVGSGHSPRTPNNVLVLSAYHRGENKLPENPFVMVELGGHSSSPDLPPFGKFTPGLDANWHAYDVWGTRDTQAAAGFGFIGTYAQAMTFDRGFGSDGIYVWPQGYDSTRIEIAERDIKGKPDSTARGKPTKQADSVPHQYRLLPVHLLLRLDSALADTNLARTSSAVVAIQRRLCTPRNHRKKECDALDPTTWASTRFDSLDVPVRRRAIEAMLLWKKDLLIDTTFNQFEARNRSFPGMPRITEQLRPTEKQREEPGKHRPWDHQSFRGACKKGKPCEGKADPTEVFKSHLFRPNTYTATFDGWMHLLLLGAKGAPTDGVEIYTGIVVPAFRSHGLPVRLGGFLELHAGINFNECCRRREFSPAFSLLQEGHRNSYVSYYVTGSWVPRRKEVTGNPDAGEFSVGVGASLLPKIWENTARIMNVIRIRAGIRFDPLHGKDILDRVRWELHFAVRQ